MSEADRRAYRSALRTEQAAATRRRILDAAAARFAAHGYASTTLAQIAAAAGVSVETVKAAGPKRTLLLAALEQTFAGAEGDTPLLDRAHFRAIEELNGAAYLSAAVDLIAAANARTARLWRALVSAADTEPAVRAALDVLLERRRADILDAVRRVRAHGLAADAPAEETAAALTFVLSPEGYEQLVLDAGLPDARYRAIVTRLTTAVLLPPGGAPPDGAAR